MKLLKQRLERFDVVFSAYDTVLGDDALHVIREYGLMWESFRLDMRDMEGWADMNPACRVVAIHDSFQNVGLGGKLASERDILDWIAQFKGDKTGFEPPSDIAEFRLFHRWDGAQEGKEDYDEERRAAPGKLRCGGFTTSTQKLCMPANSHQVPLRRSIAALIGGWRWCRGSSISTSIQDFRGLSQQKSSISMCPKPIRPLIVALRGFIEDRNGSSFQRLPYHPE
ncbi:hypothetical protein BJX62DRAFT_204320 [Aspergillus germanicus]